MRLLPIISRVTAPLSLGVLVLLPALTTSSCGHPAVTGSHPSTGSGGDSSTGSGGQGQGGDNGGSGGDNGNGGNSGSGGSSVGTGGDGVVVNPPDGGADGPPMVVKMSCADMNYSDKFTPGYSITADAQNQAKTTLASMQIGEKADQMRGSQPNQTIFNQPDNGARGIKGFRFRDGPRGLCLDAEKVGNGYSTSFPVALARGATFDLDLEYRIGDAIGDETLASGHTMLLSPTVNILRHPFWGRAQEVYGEDSYELGRFGSAFTAGLQQYVPACAKHYAANNIENGRQSDNAMMDDQTLRETYANHFGMIVQDGGVACIMASYNLVNNVKATQNKVLLTDILRTEFGFKGFVLSDWWAMPGGQGPAQGDRPNFARDAVNAGMDMELPNNLNYSTLESLVQGGTLKESQINDSATRILEQKFRFNVAKTSGTSGLKKPTTTYNGGSIGNDATHLALAEEAALKSMVLLKNDNKTLPIDRTKVKTIAVLGLTVPFTLGTEGSSQVDFVRDVRTGDRGSSRVNHDPAKAVGPLAGITAAAGAGINVVTGQAASAAANADFIIVVGGLTPQDEGEDYTGAGDRGTFSLDGKAGRPQNQLITDAAALKKPMVVVLEAGGVIDLPYLTNANVGAIVMAWYPGQRGGAALGKLLFGGDANFSGKLPITWDSKTADWPAFKTGTTTVMDYDLGYQWFDRKAVPADGYLPFGYGLSYTTFEYSNLQVPCSDVTKKGVVNVQVDITNKGTVAGDEIAFLFVSYPGSAARRHIKELKGFSRVSLAPNQTKRITIPLRISDLKYYDKGWTVASGAVQVSVGPSSRTLPLKDTFMVK
ncbi:MAG: beta-glucosidase [Myxococcales bacterium]|jgi:beta-glucosidase|nr:beta-glucosidase [Myxococcales bacterium]